LAVFAAVGAGCASFRGAPEAVFTTSERSAAIKALTFSNSAGCGDALLNYYSSNRACRLGLDQRSYRNYVTDKYVDAADGKYKDFRDALSNEMKGTAFGATSLGLLLNGIAVVSGAEGARALAAGAAVTSGAYSAFSKEVAYDKTAQALLAAIDANRTTVKIRIRTGLQQEVDHYSLRDALDDVRDLEDQASIEGAVQKLTTLATNDANAKQETLKALYVAPPLTANQVQQLAPIVAYLTTLSDSGKPEDAQILKDLAAKAKLDVSDDARMNRNNLVAWLNQKKQTDDLNAVIALFKDVTKKESY
jgi:hypothetical protein